MSDLRAELLSFLTCPETGESLTGWDGITETATLTAPISGRTYPVRDGIVCLLPEALQDAATTEYAEKRAEMLARDAQVGDYDAMVGLRLFTAAEVPLTLSYLRLEPEHLLLEGGCGTGRMTPFFADRVRGLVCVDFSMASLRVARRKLSAEQSAKTVFIQADLSKLPLRSDVFDRVGTFGVYEHIPTEDARDRAVSELLRICAPREHGSRFALSAYRWGAPIFWNAEKEGHHDGGIYFKRFTQNELRDLLSPHLQIEAMTEMLLYYHLLWGRKPARVHFAPGISKRSVGASGVAFVS
ncbi:MAG: methyltransferase domain-containing protein [Armatimonadetes bacterium]|nr:methyltransferase domain-containing protein [Armatimonadota bacterium]